MFIATAIVSAVLAALLVASASGKLLKQASQMRTLDTVRFPKKLAWLLAAAEIAGAAGLIAGLFWWPLGVAAGVALVVYFVGALVSHLRVGDRAIGGIGLPMALTVAALVLRLLTA